MHGGSAVLESRPGGGTTVTVSIPVFAEAVTEPGPGIAGDDGNSIRQFLTELSGVAGYEKYTQLYYGLNAVTGWN
jgi:hypothetical protein